MSTQIEIINKSLIMLGAEPITSLSDGTQEAKVMSRIYTQSLKSLLSETTWGFALKRVLLTQVNKTPAWTKNSMNYYYSLPSDLIAITDIANKDSRWEIQEEYLLSDSPTFGIEYTFYNNDTSKYPAYFADVLSAKLALDASYSLVNSSTITAYLDEGVLKKELLKAKSLNAKYKGTPKEVDNYGWVNSRFGR